MLRVCLFIAIMIRSSPAIVWVKWVVFLQKRDNFEDFNDGLKGVFDGIFGWNRVK